MTNNHPPVPTYQLPLHHFCSNSIGLTTKTLIQPVYTRNFSFPSTPSPSPVQYPTHSSEKQVPFRRLARLLLVYGKYCDPTSSLRGDQHLRGPIELLIWSSLLSQPFSSFHQNFLARSPWEASAQMWFSLCPWNSHHLPRWRHWWGRGILERTGAEPHINPATWKQWNSKYSAPLQTVPPIFNSHSLPRRQSSSF